MPCFWGLRSCLSHLPGQIWKFHGLARRPPQWPSKRKVGRFQIRTFELDAIGHHLSWAFGDPSTCTAWPGIRDVMAICFFRAFKRPCTPSTSVPGVSKTTSLGVSIVFGVMVAPLHRLITPWIFWSWTATSLAEIIVNGTRIAGKVKMHIARQLIFHAPPQFLRTVIH